MVQIFSKIFSDRNVKVYIFSALFRREHFIGVRWSRWKNNWWNLGYQIFAKKKLWWFEQDVDLYKCVNVDSFCEIEGK